MTYSPLELAAAFIKTGELQDALEALDQQLDAQPDDQEARRLRAEVLSRMPERWHDALADLATIEHPTPEDFTRRSVLYERLENPQAAVETMDAALTAYPGHERLIERQIYLLQKQGNLKAAIEVLSRQPKTWRWLQWSGDLAAQDGDHALAIKTYTSALNLLEDHRDNQWVHPIRARLLLARAESHRHLDQLEVARDDYEAAAALIPDDPVIPFNLGLVVSQMGNMEKAVTLCRNALNKSSAHLREQMIIELHAHYPELASVLLSDG